MKRIILLTAFVVAGLGLNAQALLKTSPGALAFGAFNACYEMPINESSSFQLSANAFFGIEGAGSAFGVGADYRAYISKTQEAPRGLYVSPGAGISFGDGANALNLRAQIGYQWVWDSGFALDLGLGPGYFIGLGDGVVGAFDGIVPTVTTAIGYQF